MFIVELFTQPVQYEFIKASTYKMVAEFYINEIQYTVHVMGDGLGPDIELGGPTEQFDNIWEVSFTASEAEPKHLSGTTDKLTGTGNAIAVFSTVIDIINEAIKFQNIQHLYFTAYSDEPSRVKLYDRLAKHFAKEGWRYIDNREIRARSYGQSANATGGTDKMYLLTKQPHPHDQLKGTRHD